MFFYCLKHGKNVSIEMTIKAIKFDIHTTGNSQGVVQNDWVEIGAYIDNLSELRFTFFLVL